MNAAAGNQGISTDGGFLNKGASGYIDGNIEGDEWYLSAGNSITFSFSGSHIKIIAGTNSDMGIANIYLDGQKVDEIDCYSSSWIKGNVLYDSGKLADQEHTVKMECSGNKNPLSTNNIIVCDAFQYVPTVIPENERITVDDSSNRVIYKGKTERLDNEKAIAVSYTHLHASTIAGFTKFAHENAMNYIGAFEHYDDPDIAYVLADTLLKRYPQIGGLYFNSANSVSFCRKLEEAGRIKDIRIIASDISKPIAEMINEGKIDFSIFSDPYLQAKRCVEKMFLLLTEGRSVVPDRFLIEPQIIMKSNLDLYVNDAEKL